MHKKLVAEATEKQLREFAYDALSMLKETNPNIYDDLEMYLYKEIYGCHFSDWLLTKALEKMENEDGTTGGHWNVDQTTSVAKQSGIMFSDNYNEYDWNYVMNMIYSDYYGSVNNDVNTYVRMSKKFLDDKDAPEGKALKYYLAMKDR